MEVRRIRVLGLRHQAKSSSCIRISPKSNKKKHKPLSRCGPICVGSPVTGDPLVLFFHRNLEINRLSDIIPFHPLIVQHSQFHEGQYFEGSS